MTLRLRLVLAVLALVTLGLGGFFAVTYLEYRGSEYARLDSQLRTYAPSVDQFLDGVNGTNAGGPFPGRRGGEGPEQQPGVPPGSFAEQLQGGTLVGRSVLFTPDLTSGSSFPQPKLPSSIPAAPPPGRIFTVGATQGSTHFRVIAVLAPNGLTTVLAIPTSEVTSALDRLLLIESAGLGSLLIVVAAGSWLILRRGLHPLERMAATASRISAGDLSERVSPAAPGTEVGELGLALNTMLDDIEAAFAERDQTEQRLRQFLSDASHELRTPLTSIQGFAELFRVSGDDARVDLPTILRRIEEESARMKVLVEDLLLLARLDEHRPIERKATDLAVLAADACTDVVATDPERPVTLDAPDPVVVQGDEVHLRQAISNLTTNALRHTPPGTRIEVGCHLDDGKAVVTVRDHGPGLDLESRAHVFDRFWQGDKSRVGTGTGLGLSIVAAVAAEHGGVATADNAPGGGALFTLRLPAG
ncbi:MAG TPA: HAMP domain-containing sensor histidine kinase [Acidimicrobiales bacterium]|nr:HAMP domain-containing sensor histidine kinase [Acidimicrobiales bacterium]